MSSPLPPDPYKVLGVAKDAKLPEIRSAHRKLVLKCHPDKVQDAALKAVKQDEFQKVQAAYDILKDDTTRQQYDNEARLFELRKEMGRGNPTPRSNPFEFEVRTAEPRANSYARAGPKVYSQPTAVPRSYEDLYEEPVRHTPKKSSSYESATDRDRKRPSRDDTRARDDLLKRMQEEEAIREAKLRDARLREQRLRDDRLQEERERAERAREKDRRDRTHAEKKKSRDKDRKTRGEEKTRTRQPFFEDDTSEDEAYRIKAAREKRRADEQFRMYEEHAAHLAAEELRAEAMAKAAASQHAQQIRSQIKEAPMTPKWKDHKDFAGAYMQAARRKAVPEHEDERPAPLRRAETFNPQGHPQAHYATPPQYSDDDAPRRSSGYKDPRRTSDTPPSKREKSRRRSPEHEDPYIVDAAAPPLPVKKPSLKTYASEPPQPSSRREPSRSKTEYPRNEPAPPPLPRAATFNVGDRGRERGSKSKYASVESDDEPSFSPRMSHSPHRVVPPTQTTYRVGQDSRAHPVQPRSHRSDLYNLNEPSYSHEPRGTPGRPVLTRNTPSGDYHTSPISYSVPEAPSTKPFVVTARPKLARESSSRHRNSPAASYDPGQIKYGPSYDQSNVKYAKYPDFYDQGRSDHYTPSRGRQEIYT